MRAVALFAAGLMAAMSAGANAAEVTVLSANGVKLFMEPLAPEFENSMGVKVTIKYGEAGDLRGFLKITRDLTDRRNQEERLREVAGVKSSLSPCGRGCLSAIEGG